MHLVFNSEKSLGLGVNTACGIVKWLTSLKGLPHARDMDRQAAKCPALSAVRLDREQVMKKVMLLAVLFVCSAFIGSSFAQMPQPDASVLWEYITKINDYKQWDSWPDYQGLQKARSPHRPLNRVYVNDKGLSSDKAPANYGTIEVKETYTVDKKLKNVTVQYKVEGFNPEAGDWYWAMYMPDGTVKKAGKIAGCIDCHAGAKDNDYVMVHNF